MLRRKRIIGTTVLVLALVFGWASAVQAGTVGLWELNEQAPGNNVSTASGAIKDTSGSANVHDGTASAGAVYTTGDPSHTDGTAIVFDAAAPPNGEYVRIPDHTDFDFGSFTIETRIKWPHSRTIGWVGASSASGKAWWLRMEYDPTNGYWLRGLVNDGSGNSLVASSTVDLTPGVWYQTALVRDVSAGTLKLYLNDTLDATNASANTGTLNINQDVFISSDMFGESKTLVIDYVRISNEALSPNPAGGYFIPEPATLAVLSLGGLLALRRRRR